MDLNFWRHFNWNTVQMHISVTTAWQLIVLVCPEASRERAASQNQSNSAAH